MPSILFEIKNNIGVIILNRPQKLNAFTRDMALLMQQKLDECNNREIRCVLITGAGNAFSAGQDLAEVADLKENGMQNILAEQFNPIVTKIRNLEKPVIAAVNGVAAGAGANIALCCDIVIASEIASFIQAFSKIGLIPDSGGTYILPRLIGWQRASAVMMLGDKITAEEAEKYGMIYKVFAGSNFSETATQLAEKVAKMSTAGLYLTKKALQLSLTHSFEEQLAIEEKLQRQAAASYDFQEGVRAFIEKRNPIFNGE